MSYVNGSQLAKKKKKFISYMFLTCPCYKIYGVEAVGLKQSSTLPCYNIYGKEAVGLKKML